MVIPSLLAHAATGEWLVTPEALHRLQLEYLSFAAGPRPPGRSKGYSRAEYFTQDDLPEIPQPAPFLNAGGIALIEINGVLGKNLDRIDKEYFGGVDYDDICSQLEAADADPGIQTIVLHFRSPGGMALGCLECGDCIAALTKPTVAYTDFLATSAAYWLAAQCDVIYTSPTAIVGSIGVLAVYLDSSKALEAIGFKVNAFSRGEWKTAGASWKPMSDDERAMFQARVDRYYAQFTDAVNRKRSTPPEYMEAQILDGIQAVEAGLADGICASLDDCLAQISAS